MNSNECWDKEIGLWFKNGPGHSAYTKNMKLVHPGPDAASRLLAAAQMDCLANINVEAVLTALKQMQWMENDDLRGCIRWYWEEDRPYDTNATFFTGLSLIVARKLFYDKFNNQCCNLLDEILNGLDLWFKKEIVHAAYQYPNKYLGDLVCKWLLWEITGRRDSKKNIEDQMRKAAIYWQEHNWGWGEHLSDIYACVCLDQLSVLLLLSEHLAKDIRKMYWQLAEELLLIEDAFFGGPRVPSLRSYAFQKAPTHVNYRDKIKPWEKMPQIFRNQPDLGNLMYQLGWHDKMPAQQMPQKDFTIPCFDGIIARARIEKDIRLGSVSRFPVMPTVEHLTWGLAWQGFPIVISRGKSDWGFMQWETTEKGITKAHPANGGPPAHIPKALTDTVSPPVCGQTFTLQQDTGILILRVMRPIPQSWDILTDRFRLIEGTAKVTESSHNGWSQLILAYPDRDVSIHHLCLGQEKKPTLSIDNDGRTDWDVTFNAPLLHKQRLIINLWAISLNGSIDAPPKINKKMIEETIRAKEEQIREIQWNWQNIQWDAVVDPIALNPLQNMQKNQA